MRATMLAARAYDDEPVLRLETTAVPAVADGDVLIGVEVAGLTRGLIAVWRSGRMRSLPAVLGHEFAGTVAAVGGGVRAVRTGQRVRAHATLCCRCCERCRAGDEVWCEQFSVIGHAAPGAGAMALFRRYRDGGLAQFVKVPEWSVQPLPDHVPAAAGAKVHSAAVCYRALRRAGVRAGCTLLLNGASGAQGAIAIRLAAALGVDRVVAVGRTHARLEAAAALAPGLVEPLAIERLGAGWEAAGGLTRRLRELTRGRGAGALVDFLPGTPAMTAQALAALGRGGRAVLAGGSREELQLAYGAIVSQGLAIEGSLGAGHGDAESVLAMLDSGTLALADLVTHTCSLERVNDAVRTVESGEGSGRLVVVRP